MYIVYRKKKIVCNSWPFGKIPCYWFPFCQFVFITKLTSTGCNLAPFSTISTIHSFGLYFGNRNCTKNIITFNMPLSEIFLFSPLLLNMYSYEIFFWFSCSHIHVGLCFGTGYNLAFCFLSQCKSILNKDWALEANVSWFFQCF